MKHIMLLFAVVFNLTCYTALSHKEQRIKRRTQDAINTLMQKFSENTDAKELQSIVQELLSTLTDSTSITPTEQQEYLQQLIDTCFTKKRIQPLRYLRSKGHPISSQGITTFDEFVAQVLDEKLITTLEQQKQCLQKLIKTCFDEKRIPPLRYLRSKSYRISLDDITEFDDFAKQVCEEGLITVEPDKEYDIWNRISVCDILKKTIKKEMLTALQKIYPCHKTSVMDDALRRGQYPLCDWLLAQNPQPPITETPHLRHLEVALRTENLLLARYLFAQLRYENLANSDFMTFITDPFAEKIFSPARECFLSGRHSKPSKFQCQVQELPNAPHSDPSESQCQVQVMPKTPYPDPCLSTCGFRGLQQAPGINLLTERIEYGFKDLLKTPFHEIFIALAILTGQDIPLPRWTSPKLEFAQQLNERIKNSDYYNHAKDCAFIGDLQNCLLNAPEDPNEQNVRRETINNFEQIKNMQSVVACVLYDKTPDRMLTVELAKMLK